MVVVFVKEYDGLVLIDQERKLKSNEKNGKIKGWPLFSLFQTKSSSPELTQWEGNCKDRKGASRQQSCTITFSV